MKFHENCSPRNEELVAPLLEGNGNVQKNLTNYDCFCAATMLTSKIIAEHIEDHSEISDCANNCNEFVSSRS